jgi:hypothetical protein
MKKREHTHNYKNSTRQSTSAHNEYKAPLILNVVEIDCEIMFSRIPRSSF